MRVIKREQSNRVWEFSRTERQRGVCTACGKVLIRYKTFQAEVGMTNRHPDGTVKTPDEVLVQMDADVKAWRPTWVCGRWKHK